LKSAGPKGPGFYFSSIPDGGSVKLKPPGADNCDWRCGLGFFETQVLGCGSVVGCEVQGLLFFTPGGDGGKLMEMFPKLRRALELVKESKVGKAIVGAGKAGRALKKGKAAEQGAKAVEDLSSELRALSEANITNSGETVLGTYSSGYVDYARSRGASYFDIGPVWDTLTEPEKTAANLHFLDVIASRGDRVVLSITKGAIDPGTTTFREIKYLEKIKGYVWIDERSLVPRRR